MLRCMYVAITIPERQVKQAKRNRRRRKISGPAAAWYRPAKRQVSLRLDADVLEWFRRGGLGYQTRINRALRKVMSEEGIAEARPPQASKSARPRETWGTPTR
jgi:uncharacterized protein (DUF4415 family)